MMLSCREPYIRTGFYAVYRFLFEFWRCEAARRRDPWDVPELGDDAASALAISDSVWPIYAITE